MQACIYICQQRVSDLESVPARCINRTDRFVPGVLISVMQEIALWVSDACCRPSLGHRGAPASFSQLRLHPDPSCILFFLAGGLCPRAPPLLLRGVAGLPMSHTGGAWTFAEHSVGLGVASGHFIPGGPVTLVLSDPDSYRTCCRQPFIHTTYSSPVRGTIMMSILQVRKLRPREGKGSQSYS